MSKETHTRREMVLGSLALALPEIEPQTTASVFTFHEVYYPKLKTDLLNLIRSGWQPVSAETFINILEGKQKIDPGLKIFLVTFDDSLASQYYQGLKTIDEVERETGWFIPAVFFIITKFNNPTAPIEETDTKSPCYNDKVHSYMTLSEVVESLKRGHNIQNHTVDHPDLTILEADKRNAQIGTAERRIEKIYKMAGVKRGVKLFAYPYGSYKNITGVIEAFGFDAAFTTRGSSLHTPSNRFTLGRFSKS